MDFIQCVVSPLPFSRRSLLSHPAGPPTNPGYLECPHHLTLVSPSTPPPPPLPIEVQLLFRPEL
eukprot:scaffold2761_cov148-Isochrysis_galbana.AAC.6